MADVRISDERLVQAPAEAVWAAIKDPSAHADWHPFVTAIEGEHELGAARACSVTVGGRAGATRERCVDLVPGRKIMWAIDDDSTGFSRMVSDWQAGFELAPEGDATRVTAVSLFRPRSVVLRLMTPLVRRKFHATQTSILAALAEASAAG
jgi:uncharacterized protein YndB with AHSA1/START domain